MQRLFEKYYQILFGRVSALSYEQDSQQKSTLSLLSPISQEDAQVQEEDRKEMGTYTFKTQTLITKDGTHLYAKEHRQRNSTRTAVIIPSQDFDGLDCRHTIARAYTEKNYHVVILGLRGCGDNEGNYVSYGITELEDVKAWIDFLVFLHPEDEIVLHGCSVGGTIACLLSKENLPKQVKSIVVDSPLVSIKKALLRKLKQWFLFPRRLVLCLLAARLKKQTGISLFATDVVSHVQEAKLPMLFIHGKQDNYIPAKTAQPLFDACPSEKEPLLLENSGHCMGALHDKKTYFSTIFKFIDPFFSKEEDEEDKQEA